MTCPRCRSNKMKEAPDLKGRQYRCPDCGYEGPTMEGVF